MQTSHSKHARDLKHKASAVNYAIAIQSKPQKAKNTQNSPKACQNNTKTCMDYSQGKLEWKAKTPSTLG